MEPPDIIKELVASVLKPLIYLACICGNFEGVYQDPCKAIVTCKCGGKRTWLEIANYGGYRGRT